LAGTELDVFTPLGQDNGAGDAESPGNIAFAFGPASRPGAKTGGRRAWSLAMVGRQLAEQYPESKQRPAPSSQKPLRVDVGDVRSTLFLAAGSRQPGVVDRRASM